MRTFLFLSLILLLGTSCEKFIAKDISNELPVLIVPAANDTINTNPVHFKWGEVDGAEKYHLMVVSPSFSSISSYVLDTMVYGTEFYYDLDSNAYELKLAAVNGGYVSDTLGPVKFWVGVQPSSSGSSVVLSTPLDAAYVNGTFDGKFYWQAVSGVDSYEFSLRQGASFAAGTMLDAQNGISTLNCTSSYTFTEGSYYWGIMAFLTAGGQTAYSVRTLNVDLTAPNQAVLGSPANFGSESSGSITFSWSNGSDPGTIHAPVNSKVEVATDANFVNITQTQTVQGNSTTITISTAGTYFWRVTNSDDAGNVALESDANQFTVN